MQLLHSQFELTVKSVGLELLALTSAVNTGVCSGFIMADSVSGKCDEDTGVDPVSLGMLFQGQ